MIRRKRTEVTVETLELFVSGRTNASVEEWCQECPEPSRMFSPEQAAVLAGVSQRFLYRMIEAEQVHFKETPGGRILVCPSSLLEAFK